MKLEKVTNLARINGYDNHDFFHDMVVFLFHHQKVMGIILKWSLFFGHYFKVMSKKEVITCSLPSKVIIIGSITSHYLPGDGFE